MGLLAYAYTPLGTPDLVRYFEIIDRCKGLSLLEVIRMLNDGLWVENIIYWLVAAVNMPHLLPFFAAITVYGSMGYIAIDAAERFDSNRILIIYLFQIMAVPFIGTISNVRNISAFALIILAVYRDMVQKKRDIVTILLYILPCFWHSMGFFLVLTRLICLLSGVIFVILAGILIFTPQFITLLYTNNIFHNAPGTIGRMLNLFVQQAYGYMNDRGQNSTWTRSVMNSGSFRLQRIAFFAIAIIIIYFSIKHYRQTETEYDRKYDLFAIFIAGITLACNVTETTVYWRFGTATIIASGPILNSIFINNKYSSIIDKIISFLLLVCAFVLMLLNIRISRINIDYGEYFSTAFITSIYSVIAQLFWNLLV